MCVWGGRVEISRDDQRKAREAFPLGHVNLAMPSPPHAAAGGRLPHGETHGNGPTPGEMPGLSPFPILSQATTACGLQPLAWDPPGAGGFQAQKPFKGP